jgi:hypothetical protein
MELFQENLTKSNENFKEAFFVDSNYFTFGGENLRKFDEEFFGSGFFLEHRYKLGNLKFSDLVHGNGGIKSWRDFTASSNIPITEEKYEIIRRCGVDILGGGGGGCGGGQPSTATPTSRAG